MSTTFSPEMIEKMRHGWLPAHIYNDEVIYAEERERIFGSSWQFLAHTSEVPEPGDYVVRRVVDNSFIVARGEDNEVRVMFNMCLHRGMQLCRAEIGNSSHFRCPYHGWTFKNDGKLTGVPFHADAYGGDDGLVRDDLHLLRPNSTQIVNGMVFVNLAAEPQPFDEYLGGAMDFLSFYTAPSPEGVEMWGPQRWRAGWNWKIAAENFCGDSYHTPHTHASMFEIGLTPQIKGGSRKTGGTYEAGRGWGASFGLGEGSLADKLRMMGYTEEAIADREKHWPSSIVELIQDVGQMPSSITIFPNLSFLHLWATIDDEGSTAPFTTMRLWQPVSESQTEVFSWFVVDKNASDEFKEKSRRAYLMAFGSSGMFEQDDMENWLSLTKTAKGSMAKNLYLNGRMGLLESDQPLREPLDGFSGPGTVTQGFNESNQRAWMNHYVESMLEQDCMNSTKAGEA